MRDKMVFLVIIIVFLFVCVIIGISQGNEAAAQYKSLKESVTSKYGEPTKVIDDYGIGDNETVYVFEQPQIIVIKGKEYGFDSLLDFSVNGGQSYTENSSPLSVHKNTMLLSKKFSKLVG